MIGQKFFVNCKINVK